MKWRSLKTVGSDNLWYQLVDEKRIYVYLGDADKYKARNFEGALVQMNDVPPGGWLLHEATGQTRVARTCPLMAMSLDEAKAYAEVWFSSLDDPKGEPI